MTAFLPRLQRLLYFAFYDEYSTIVSLDYDLFIVRSIQSLFATVPNRKQIAVAFQIPPMINGGVVVIKPNQSTFEAMADINQYWQFTNLSNDSQWIQKMDDTFWVSEQSFLQTFYAPIIKGSNATNPKVTVLSNAYNYVVSYCQKACVTTVSDLKMSRFGTSRRDQKAWSYFQYNETQN